MFFNLFRFDVSMQVDPKTIQEMKKGYKNKKNDYSRLVPVEKTKVRACAKWNFYSQKCRSCKFELICADQWKVREWLGDKTRREQQKKTRLLNDIDLLLNTIKESFVKENLSLKQLIRIKNNLLLATE